MESKWTLIKADVDRYMLNQDYARLQFLQGYPYLLKLLVLFFVAPKHCFRTIFYYRIGRWSVLFRLIFPPAYKDTYIWCPKVAGGGIFFAHPYGTVLNCEHIGCGCAFAHHITLGNKRRKDGSLARPYLENFVE